MDRRVTNVAASPVKKQEEQEVKELRKALKNAQLELEILKKKPFTSFPRAMGSLPICSK
jgi:hypothetical protein